MANDCEQNSTSNLMPLKTKISNIQDMRSKIHSFMQEEEEALKKIKPWQIAASEKVDKLRDLFKEQRHAEEENQKLKKALDALEQQNNVGEAAKGVQLMLSNLGCTLETADGMEAKRLYKFDFGQNRSITIEYDSFRFVLVEMTPESPNRNFAEIKAFAEQTQDLLGLLMHF